MKSRILACIAAGLIMMASAPAFAHSCPLVMKKIDTALVTAKLSKADMDKVMGLRATGEAMHKSGKHDESMKALMEAEKILGIN